MAACVLDICTIPVLLSSTFSLPQVFGSSCEPFLYGAAPTIDEERICPSCNETMRPPPCQSLPERKCGRIARVSSSGKRVRWSDECGSELEAVRLFDTCGVKGEQVQLMLIVAGETEVIEEQDIFLCLQ